MTIKIGSKVVETEAEMEARRAMRNTEGIYWDRDIIARESKRIDEGLVDPMCGRH